MSDSLSPATPEMTETHAEYLAKCIDPDAKHTAVEAECGVCRTHRELSALVRSLVSREKVLVDPKEVETALGIISVERVPESARDILGSMFRRWLSQSGAKQ